MMISNIQITYYRTKLFAIRVKDLDSYINDGTFTDTFLYKCKIEEYRRYWAVYSMYYSRSEAEILANQLLRFYIFMMRKQINLLNKDIINIKNIQIVRAISQFEV